MNKNVQRATDEMRRVATGLKAKRHRRAADLMRLADVLAVPDLKHRPVSQRRQPVRR